MRDFPPPNDAFGHWNRPQWTTLIELLKSSTSDHGGLPETHQLLLPSNSFPLSCATDAVTGVVEEEQLPVRLQLPAGNEDTTDVTGLDTDENGPNTVTNVIVGTFSSSLSFTGNDGPVAYSFLPVLDGTQVLKTDGGNLTSQGRQCAVCSLRRHADRLRGRG